MAIEDMLHGLRRWIFFLNPTNLSTFLCLRLYEKFQFSHLHWDVFAINTAQDDMLNCGNSRNILQLQPGRALLFGASQGSVIPLLFLCKYKGLNYSFSLKECNYI